MNADQSCQPSAFSRHDASRAFVDVLCAVKCFFDLRMTEFSTDHLTAYETATVASFEGVSRRMTHDPWAT